MAISKGDFIEIEFTGKIKDTGEVFDTTYKKIAEDAGLKIKEIKPFTFAVGHHMLPKGFDDDFEGKDVGKSYTLDLKPEKAFGKRDKSLIKMIPTKLFHEQKINPYRGLQLNLDGQIVRVLSSSGGRTMVDFNNPLAGKEIIYDYTITKEIKDDMEKVNALQDFLFRQRFDFEIKDKKVLFSVDEKMEPMIKMFSKKLQEILGLEVDVEKK